MINQHSTELLDSTIKSQPITTRPSRWNNKLEHTAKDIGEISNSYKLMHLEVAQTAYSMYDFYMKLGIVLGPIAGMLSGVGAVTHPEDNVVFPVIVTIVSFLSGIVVAIIKFSKYDEVGTAHKTAAARYTSLESNVRRQLALSRSDRVSAREYVDWLSSSFDELFLASPILPTSVYTKICEQAKKSGMAIPIEYQKIICINHDYEDEKIREIVNNTSITIENDEKHDKDESIQVEKEEKHDNDESIQVEKEEKKNNKENMEKVKELRLDMKSIKMAKKNCNKADYKITSNKIYGTKQIKRTNSFSNFPELEKYNDGLMNYEMNRMMRFNN